MFFQSIIDFLKISSFKLWNNFCISWLVYRFVSLYLFSFFPWVVEKFPTIQKLQWMKKKLMEVNIRVSKTQQTKNWLRGRLHWRELTTPTLKSLPYVPFALLFSKKRPAGRFSSSLLRLLFFFIRDLSIECTFTVICAAWGPLQKGITSNCNTFLHSSKRHVLNRKWLLAMGAPIFVAQAKVSLIFCYMKWTPYYYYVLLILATYIHRYTNYYSTNEKSTKQPYLNQANTNL